METPSVRSMRCSHLVAAVCAIPGAAWASPATEPAPPPSRAAFGGRCSIEQPEGVAGVYIPNQWDGGIVPYEFDDAVGKGTYVTPENRARTLAALAEIEAVCAVRFVPRSGEADYIHIQNANVNQSWVGKKGGVQFLSMTDWYKRFIIVHEFMHALGLWHEQQRNDRDQYVEVLYDKIPNNNKGNFDIQPGSIDYGSYDFDSVMHYQPYSGGKIAGDRTILVREPYRKAWQYAIGQLDEPDARLSNGDVWVLCELYGGGVRPGPLRSVHRPTARWWGRGGHPRSRGSRPSRPRSTACWSMTIPPSTAPR